MSEWSIDLSQHENEAAVYYVTWAATSTSSAADQAQKYGRSLGRLSAPDLKEVVSKGILSYSKYCITKCTYCMGTNFQGYIFTVSIIHTYIHISYLL